MSATVASSTSRSPQAGHEPDGGARRATYLRPGRLEPMTHQQQALIRKHMRAGSSPHSHPATRSRPKQPRRLACAQNDLFCIRRRYRADDRRSMQIGGSRASHDQPHSLSVIGTLARGIPYRLVEAAGNCCCGAVHARGEGPGSASRCRGRRLGDVGVQGRPLTCRAREPSLLSMSNPAVQPFSSRCGKLPP